MAQYELFLGAMCSKGLSRAKHAMNAHTSMTSRAVLNSAGDINLCLLQALAD